MTIGELGNSILTNDKLADYLNLAGDSCGAEFSNAVTGRSRRWLLPTTAINVLIFRLAHSLIRPQVAHKIYRIIIIFWYASLDTFPLYFLTLFPIRHASINATIAGMKVQQKIM